MKQIIYTSGIFETELKVWPHGEDIESYSERPWMLEYLFPEIAKEVEE